jgi:hypothetical protein
MPSYTFEFGNANRKTRRALTKIARSKRIRSNRLRNRAVQRLLGVGPLEAIDVLQGTPTAPHRSRIERAAREDLAEHTEKLRAEKAESTP